MSSESSGKFRVNRSWAIVLIVMMSLSGLVIVATDNVAALQDGDYTYTVSDGKATITGYTGAGGDITIPSTLGGYPTVFIESSVFNGCTSLTSVTIPDSVISLGFSGAFADCTSLTSVIIGNGVSYIGFWTFKDCTSLTSVTLGKQVTGIAKYWPQTDVDMGAFYGCTSLTSVTIGNIITDLESHFPQCRSLTILEGVTSIPAEAFREWTYLSSVTIPDSVTSIGDSAFFDCINLTSIEFLGIKSPALVGDNWIGQTPSDIRGHAYETSNYPVPGSTFYGLTMGEYLIPSKPETSNIFSISDTTAITWIAGGIVIISMVTLLFVYVRQKKKGK